MTEDRGQMTEGYEFGMADRGHRATPRREVGMRPPASPSCRLYEPEAVGAIGAYAPEGMRN